MCQLGTKNWVSVLCGRGGLGRMDYWLGTVEKVAEEREECPCLGMSGHHLVGHTCVGGGLNWVGFLLVDMAAIVYREW